MLLNFNKFHGAGNDFILVDIRENKPRLNREIINALCDRRLGIGADGLISLDHDPSFPFLMRYYNSDGNESTMCGNGGRCIALFANILGFTQKELHFNAIDGAHTAIILEKSDGSGLVRLHMRDVSEIESHTGYLLLNTGSPHYVCFRENVQKLDVAAEGRKIRYSGRFKQEGINVNFVEKTTEGLFVRTYERGVEDETLSCGTGVTASVLAYSLVNPEIESPVCVNTPGGLLKVYFYKRQTEFTDVWLEGPAVKVFEGSINI
ncbi:MAG: diaminopimelate epimerase [Bacteroidales bacterium]